MKKPRKMFDGQYRDSVISSVSESKNGWSITMKEGFSFWVPKEYGVEPLLGQIARFYGRGFGYVVRGLDIDGEECFYRTAQEQDDKNAQEICDSQAEQKAEFEKNKTVVDARYEKLPDVFRRRIDKFRANNPDFRWKYEGYEMFTCEQAVLIAEALGSTEAISVFADKDFKEQQLLVPGLSDGHSGNTFGCACYLASAYLGSPDAVIAQYGALAPLVGSKEYGCVPA